MVALMVSDGVVSTPTLKRRLRRVRLAQQYGTLATPYQFKRVKQPEYTASELLVPPEWFKDALETRALELELMIVSAIGVTGIKYRVRRETLVIEEFEVEALTPDQALLAVKTERASLKRSSNEVLKFKIEEVEE